MTPRPASSGGGSGGGVESAGQPPGQPPSKRARHASPNSPQGDGEPAPAKAGQSSSFRNVSACNRCRLRKNRCDQRLPSCMSCEKAGVKCVGYDPITKREIPRSYVFYLETRIAYLEDLLVSHNIPFDPAEVLNSTIRPQPESQIQTPIEEEIKVPEESRHLGSGSGISFARVVFAAVKSTINSNGSDKNSHKGSIIALPTKATISDAGGTTMRDSFFGLQTKSNIKQAPFPEKPIARKLIDLYFEHANPQIPILHRGEFEKMFELAYSEDGVRVRGPRELYMLNIVYAIGSGIVVEKPESETRQEPSSSIQCQPEEYHASAIIHLDACLSASSTAGLEGLEELQAVLLLAGFALLRPVPPGLWYITGVAVRLAVDLGLYQEEPIKEEPENDRGRREWIREMRRRLWWSTYCFDRLVSTCVGRPFGISDQVITTEFPSLLEDKYITSTGFLEPPGGPGEATSKAVAYHYLRLRLLQSEILQVLQHQQAQLTRATGVNQKNPYMHIDLPSPFLHRFASFRDWRIDIDKRLWHWKTSAPTKRETGVQFSTDFLELNYWQAVIMLYRQSLSVPPVFQGEYNTSDEVESPRGNLTSVELREDEERVYLKVAEAGQKVLRIYRKIHRIHLVNYTYLATHHLFMAGISFLYAIWHSPVVRSRLTVDEVDFTILAATSVLGDLVDKCPPAEACRDAFDRMSKATVQMCLSTTGFGSSAGAHGLNTRRGQDDYFGSKPPARPKHKFDMGLNDLYMRTRPVKAEMPASSMSPDNSAIDPSLLPGNSPGTPGHYDPTPQRSPNTNGQSAFQFNGPMDVQNMDLGFLQGNGYTNDAQNNGQGYDLGMSLGLSWDGMDHDFTDGNQFDLFDGFFFGGNSNVQ